VTIHLRLERIVLEGVTLSAGERVRLEGALVAELTRMLAMPGAQKALGDQRAVESMSAPTIRGAPNEAGAALGVRLARSVFGALAGGAAAVEVGPGRGNVGPATHGGAT
jgi:hypothetical protein